MDEDRGLIRFWLAFEGDGPAFVGVTACDRDDAFEIARQTFWPNHNMPVPSSVTENIDVSQIPEWCHALVGVPAWRGIWYPHQGY